MDPIKEVEKNYTKKLPDIKPGYTVKVYQKIKEEDKERIQVFEGMVIARSGGNGPRGTFTVRKVTSGVGVERIFPLHSPLISKIEITGKSKVRRAKLYYLRKQIRGEDRLIEDKEGFAKVKEEVKNIEKETANAEIAKDVTAKGAKETAKDAKDVSLREIPRRGTNAESAKVTAENAKVSAKGTKEVMKNVKNAEKVKTSQEVSKEKIKK